MKPKPTATDPWATGVGEFDPGDAFAPSVPAVFPAPPKPSSVVRHAADDDRPRKKGKGRKPPRAMPLLEDL